MLLHWLIAAALLAQVALGWWMLELPKSPPGLRAGWFNLHKSIGLAIAALVVLRLAWRVTHAPVAKEAPAWQRMAARANHALLYAAMAALPATGYLGSAFSGYPVRFFGWVIPSWHARWPEGKAFMSDAHELLAWLLMACVAVHLLAVLWHSLRGEGIIGRMALR